MKVRERALESKVPVRPARAAAQDVSQRVQVFAVSSRSAAAVHTVAAPHIRSR
jgi:hypothetical protein